MRSANLKVQSSREAPKYRAPGGDDAGFLVDAPEPVWVRGPLLLNDGPSSVRHPFDPLVRTAVFGEQVVKCCRRVPRNPVHDRLAGQLAGAATSVGASYCEASEAVSRKGFLGTIGRSGKEARETRRFLRMVVASEPFFADAARPLCLEATGLLRIFASMRKKRRDQPEP